MIVVDPMAPDLSEKRRQVLQIRDRAVAIAETLGRPDPAIPISPHRFFKGDAIEILYLPIPERAPSETALTMRAEWPMHRLEIWAKEIRGPGPALTKVAAMIKVTSPIHISFGEPRKVFNIQWQSATSTIRVVSFIRGRWERYLLEMNPEHMA